MVEPKPGNRRSRPATLAAVRAEVSRMRQSLDRIETVLAQLDTDEPPRGARARPERYFQVLVDIYERGRHGVPADVFTQLGRDRGYDARGLGGFFVGTRAPLQRSGDLVELTAEGHRLLDEYLTRPTP